jgi:hypothetical protein
MTLTVRQSSVVGAVTKGSPLTYAELDANFAHLSSAANISVTQSGTGAGSTDLQTRGRKILYATDFYANGSSGALVVGDSATDNTTGIQNAINACPEGGTVVFPAASGHYLFTTLTISKGITLAGQGWFTSTKEVFGTAAYLTEPLGSILRSTSTGSVNAITSTTLGKNPVFKDIALIGPGSGTSTGIAFGSGASYQVLGKWSNVLIANFSVGVVLTNVEDYTFDTLRIRGCTTGITFQSGVAGTNTNQNVFLNFEVQKCTTGVNVTEASTNIFYGGLVQGNTTGVKFAPSADGRVATFVFDGLWWETNTTPITLDLTNGSMQSLELSRNNLNWTGNLFSLTNPNNKTLTFLSLRNNQGASVTVDLSPGASVGPAYNKVVIDGSNSFSAYTYSNAAVINLSDNNLRVVGGSILPALSAGSAVWAMDGNQTGVSIANNATATPFGNSNNFSGMFWVNDTNTGTGAIFITGNGVIVLVSQTSTNYTVTATSANKVNVYLSGNVVTIENKSGGTTEARVIAFRTRASQ